MFSPESLELRGVNYPHGKQMLLEAIRDRYEWTGLGDGFYETFITEHKFATMSSSSKAFCKPAINNHGLFFVHVILHESTLIFKSAIAP